MSNIAIGGILSRGNWGKFIGTIVYIWLMTKVVDVIYKSCIGVLSTKFGLRDERKHNVRITYNLPGPIHAST